MRNFWNWIGLPSAKDVQALVQTCQEQQQQISSLDQEVQELKAALSTHMDEIWKQATERQDSQTSALCRMIQTSLDAQDELLRQFAETAAQSAEKNQAALTASQQDILNRLGEQNAWLRLAVVNSLREELDSVLAAGTKSAQKPAAKTRSASANKAKSAKAQTEMLPSMEESTPLNSFAVSSARLLRNYLETYNGRKE